MVYYTWMLSKFYHDPIHGWDVPVCSAYGGNFVCVRHPDPPGEWGLVYLDTTLQQVEAAKQDPRVVVCGKAYDPPPKKLLQEWASWLDPNVTYLFMGQVLSKLSETEPAFAAPSQ